MKRRLSRAKSKIKATGIRSPSRPIIYCPTAGRGAGVVYLIYNEGIRTARRIDWREASGWAVCSSH